MIDTISQLASANVFNDSAAQFRADVLRGLFTPERKLTCKYFYDDVGSALFEQITGLDEYYPTRTELATMEQHAAEMAGQLRPRCLLIKCGFTVDRVGIDGRQYSSVAYLSLCHSGNDRMLPGQAGDRAMLPAHEAISATL